MENKKINSTIRLFDAVLVTDKNKKREITKEILEKTIRYGFVLSPEIIGNYSNYNDIIDRVIKECGLTPEQLNSSLHKSWDKIENAPEMQLVFEQIMHYITTYGFEMLGCYSEDTVYIPYERLEIPELQDNIKLKVIKGYTIEELKEKLLGLINSGIALKEDTINDIVEVSKLVGLTQSEIENSKNKEVKVRLFDDLGLVPGNPTEFLRYVIYKMTGETLIIKNNYLIEKIKESNYDPSLEFKQYNITNRFGFKTLAKSFNRYKPLYLAMKKSKDMNTIVNRIARLSKDWHEPIKEDYLNTITEKIKNNEPISFELITELNKANIWRKIRLLYAVNMLGKSESSLYKIRNGKAFAKEADTGSYYTDDIVKAIRQSIVSDIKDNVKDKKIYIPNYINYALPSSEKQFTGNFPSGTSVTIDEDMIVGINWFNVHGNRIDLDLSIIDENGKTGWDSTYRNDERTVLFSGDVTNAGGKNGATELFYIKKQAPSPKLMFVNYYNYSADVEVPMNIIVAKENPKSFKNNYMVDPNNLLSVAKSTVNKKQKILGLIIPEENHTKFYFCESYLGNNITSSGKDYVTHTRKYLFDYYRNMIDFKDVLKEAGATIVEEMSEEIDIDLSPENLEKDTIIKLLMKNE